MRLDICGSSVLTASQVNHVQTTLQRHSDLKLAIIGDDKSYFLSQQVAEQVLVNHLPEMIEMLQRQSKPEGFAVVIGNGRGQVILIYLEGDPSSWSEWDFLDIAIRKFKMAWRWKTNTINVKAHMIELGDTVFRGGVFVEGLPGAVSGFDEEEDQYHGLWIMHDLVEACFQMELQWRQDEPDAQTYG